MTMVYYVRIFYLSIYRKFYTTVTYRKVPRETLHLLTFHQMYVDADERTENVKMLERNTKYLHPPWFCGNMSIGAGAVCFPATDSNH